MKIPKLLKSLPRSIVYGMLLLLIVNLVGMLLTVTYYHEPISSYPEILSSRLDTVHYISIAEGGYHKEADYLFAFFPLFPIQISVLQGLTGIDFSVAALVIANLNFLGMCFVLDKFLKKICASIGISPNPEKLMLLSLSMPFVMFTWIPYTEGLFIMLSLAYLYWLLFKQQDKSIFLVLPMLAALVALSRSVAIAIPLTTMCYLLVMLWSRSFGEFKAKLREHRLLVISGVGSIFSFSVALLGFFAYGYKITGDFLISRHVQDYWGRGSTLNVLHPIYERLAIIFSPDKLSTVCTDLVCSKSFFVELIAIIIVICCLIYTYRVSMSALALKICYLFSLIVIVLPLTSDSLISFNRYQIAAPLMLISLPVMLFQSKYAQYASIVFICLLLFNLALFGLHFSGFWVG